MKTRYDWLLAGTMYRDGRRDRDIAIALGCTPASVRKWRTAHNLPCHSVYFPRERRDTVAKLLREGKSCNEVSALEGLTIEFVRGIGRRFGIAMAHPPRRIPDKSLGIIDKSGYILLRVEADGPHGNLIRFLGKGRTRGYALLHRMRMQDRLGRTLADNEVVHHRDGDKYNNSPANLELFSDNGAHLAASLSGKCPKWTADGKRRIAEGNKKPRGPFAGPYVQSYRRLPILPPAASRQPSKTDVPASPSERVPMPSQS